LLETGIVGVISRLETDGTGPDTISKLRKILVARKEPCSLFQSRRVCGGMKDTKISGFRPRR
jgi:hypothetical protein